MSVSSAMAHVEPTAQAAAENAGDNAGKTGIIRQFTGRKLHAAIGAAAACLLVGGVVLYLNRDQGPTPREMLQNALDLIDKNENLDARSEAIEIARQLRKMGYRDPDFAGGTEFVLGIASFRNANELGEFRRERMYLAAANELKKCEALALDKSRRPEWSFALGSSLYEVGKASEARPLLEEAIETYEPGRIEASIRLADIYTDLKTKELLLLAVPLLKNIAATKGLGRSQYDGAYLRIAQVYLALGRQTEAEKALKQVSNDTQGNQGTIVFRAQTLMAEAEATKAEAAQLSDRAKAAAEQAQQAARQGRTDDVARLNAEADSASEEALGLRKRAEAKFEDAMRQLEPVANDIGLEQTYARQASYLLGVCAEGIDDTDAAINHLERTAEKYAQTQEGVAASLRAADLLRRAGRNEEALNKRYRSALVSVKRPEDFRNRWLSVKQFREQIQTAFEEWSAAHDYQEAIVLAGMMTPLFPRVQALEFTARANQNWAEHLEDKLKHTAYSSRQNLEREFRERWRMSGKSHALLAEELTTTAEYPNSLRISAEHYWRGHDFENSLRQWNLFIDTRPTARLPEALVNRGKVLMDLDRLEDAQMEFQLVIENYPTDSAAFEAQYVLGLCYLEQNQLGEAEKTWRAMITSDSLTPAARQWQLALVSLGRLLYHTAVMKKLAADSSQSELEEKDRQPLAEEAFRRWDEAIRHLELFLAFISRDARHPEAVAAKSEARYLLAKSLRHAAAQPQQKLESAETENARLELRRTMQGLLGQARDTYRTLQSDLLALEETDMLGSLEQHLLRDCFFDLAHTYYALAGFGLDSPEDNYNKAIVAYGAAANKYPQDPQVILAYLQISKCYEQLGEMSDSRSSLEQAKVILKQMPDSVFAANTTGMSKLEWQGWLEWMQSLQQSTKPASVQTQ